LPLWRFVEAGKIAGAVLSRLALVGDRSLLATAVL